MAPSPLSVSTWAAHGVFLHNRGKQSSPYADVFRCKAATALTPGPLPEGEET